MSINVQSISSHVILTTCYSRISPHLNEMMKLLSGAGEEPVVISPFVFQQVFGAIFTGNDEEPMNGETQEDAHEFMIKLFD